MLGVSSEKVADEKRYVQTEREVEFAHQRANRVAVDAFTQTENSDNSPGLENRVNLAFEEQPIEEALIALNLRKSDVLSLFDETFPSLEEWKDQQSYHEQLKHWHNTSLYDNGVKETLQKINTHLKQLPAIQRKPIFKLIAHTLHKGGLDEILEKTESACKIQSWIKDIIKQGSVSYLNHQINAEIHKNEPLRDYLFNCLTGIAPKIRLNYDPSKGMSIWLHPLKWLEEEGYITTENFYYQSRVEGDKEITKEEYERGDNPNNNLHWRIASITEKASRLLSVIQV